jgi:pimeloyl-ACP methyl ester carboxylesterase
MVNGPANVGVAATTTFNNSQISASCTYTMTVPQGTPALSFMGGNNFMGDSSPSSRVSFTWNISATLSPGGQAYTNAGSITASSLPEAPLWAPSQCMDPPPWPPGVLWNCIWTGNQTGVIPLGTLTQNQDVQLTLSVSGTQPAEVPGQNTASLWVQPVTTINTLDPVPELLSGNGILTDPNSLATLGTPVTGIAADGVARVLLRIPALSVGEQLTLTLLDDQGNPNPLAEGYAKLAAIGGPVQPSPLQLTAVGTLQGPMAFAIYIAPGNFNYQGLYSSATTRAVSFAVQAADATSFNTTAALKILRPPVLLVHGMWGDPSDWSNFTPLINDPRFFVRRATYNYPISGSILGSTPTYASYSGASMNGLGFSHNATAFLQQLPTVLTEYRSANQAAAAQVDVIGHSMGGLVTRAAENLPGFMSSDSFGVGYIHKLITIGTPHLGSPLALDLLNGQNQCIADELASLGSFSFLTVTLAGEPIVVPGAIGDLEGSGLGGNLSLSLQGLQQDNGHPVPTAMIAGETADANLAGLNCVLASGCIAAIARQFCSNSQLGPLLTAAGWPPIFGSDSSDAIVNLTSEQAGLTSTNIQGVIHTVALEQLDFVGPPELDSLSGIPPLVTQLLNSPATQATGFYPLP